MNEKIKTRYEKAKDYVRDHAPQIVTATASLGSLIVLSSMQKNVNRLTKDVNYLKRSEQGNWDQRIENTRFMQECIENNRKFDYLPGIGVYVHPAHEKLDTSKD